MTVPCILCGGQGWIVHRLGARGRRVTVTRRCRACLPHRLQARFASPGSVWQNEKPAAQPSTGTRTSGNPTTATGAVRSSTGRAVPSPPRP